MNWLEENWFKVSILAIALFIAICAGYYFVYLPRQNILSQQEVVQESPRINEEVPTFNDFQESNIVLTFQKVIALFLVIFLIVLALSFKPIRKTIGLLIVILGALVCMTVIGIIFGIPMIIIGGLFLFI